MNHFMRPWPLTALSVGWMLGTACHLEQVTLQSSTVYGAWWCVSVGVAWLWATRGTGAGGGGLEPFPVRAGPRKQTCVIVCRGWSVPAWTRQTLAVAVSASLAMSGAGWRATQQLKDRLAPEWEGIDLVLEGVVERLPQRQPESIRFVLAVERAWRTDTHESLPAFPPRVWLGWQTGPPGDGLSGSQSPIRVAERWRLPVRLKAAHGTFNPHAGDPEAGWWSQGVLALGQVRLITSRDEQAQRLATGAGHWIEQWREACRDRLWQQGLEPRVAGVVSALVLGDQTAIDPLDWDVFRRTGVAHLMSISGLHITLLAAAMRAAVSWAWRRAGWRGRPLALWWPASTAGWWGGLLMAGLYAAFSGGGLPAQRTVLMLGVLVWLKTWGLRWPWWTTWSLSCAVVLAWDPWAWLQVGFWLSFVAVALLMVLDERAAVAPPPLPRASSSTPRRRMLDGLSSLGRAASGLWREQWRITCGLAPLTLLLFREVSLIGVLANLLAIPWVTLCVTPLALVGALWSPAWLAAAEALKVLQWGLNTMLQWGVPTWSVSAFPVWVACVGVLGAALLCLSAPWWLRGWGLPLLAPALGWQATPPPVGEVAVVVADVGQGQAVLVRTAQHALLYDAGPRYSQEFDAGQRVVVPLLKAYGVTLDRLVLSHRDADHTGGALAVLDMQPQVQVLGSLPSRSAIAQRAGYQDCEAGQTWTWEGVHFEVLHPTSSGPARATSNAWSCVLRIQTATSSVLLAGDIESHEEAAMVRAWGAALRTDVLLVPHHGSRTSSTSAWLDAVRPHTAWVQAGYRNRYGHPAPDVVERYRARHIHLLETTRCGAIQWSSLEPKTMQCEREVRRRFWHHTPPA